MCILILAVLPTIILAQQDAFTTALAEARRLSRLPDVAAAMEAFERAAQAAANDTDRARAWFELAAFCEMRAKPQQALEALGKILALQAPSPWHPQALERSARLYQRLGKLEEALRAYERLANLEGADPLSVQDGLAGQMRMLQQLGDLDRAADVAKGLIAKYPDSLYRSQAAAVVVNQALAAGDADAALQAAEAEARREGGDVFLLFRVGDELRKAGQLAEALRALEAFLQAQPDDPAAAEAIYEVHLEAGTLPQYEKQLSEAARKPDTRPAALRRLANLYRLEDRPEQALAALDELVALTPNDPTALAQAAQAALDLGQAKSAADYLQRALALQPQATHLAARLGDAYAQLGEREKAVAAWRRAARLDTAGMRAEQLLQATRMFGQLLSARGYFEDAVSAYLQARQTLGDETALAADLGQAYESLLRTEDAVREYLSAMREADAWAALAEARLRALATDETTGPAVIAALEAARETQDPPPGAMSALGFAYLTARNEAGAARAFEAIRDPVQRGQVLLRAAADLDQEGDHSGAAAMYEAATRAPLDPATGARAKLRLATLWRQDGEWRKALELLQSVGADGAPPGLLDRAQLEVADILVLDGGDFAAAADLYARLLGRSGDQEAVTRAAWGLADCAFVAGRYAEAAEAYRNLAAAGAEGGLAEPPAPPFGEAPEAPYVLMGWPAEDAGRPMGPEYAAYQLAEIEFRSGHVPQARQQFEKLASRWPHSRYANDALRRVLLISEEFTGESPAESEYLKALALVDRGDLRAVTRILEMIAAPGPQEPLADDATMLLADALRRFGSKNEAQQQYAKLAERFPESPLAPRALLQAAELLVGQPQRRQEAVTLLRSIRQKYPLSPEAAQAEACIDELRGG